MKNLRLFALCQFFFSLIFIGCSSSSHQDLSSEGQLPGWVSSPLRYSELNCHSEFLCVVAEGRSLEQAHSNARAEMARLFRVSVSQETEFGIFSTQVSAPDSFNTRDESTQNIESFSQKLREVTREVLDGVQIVENFREGPRSYFSMAVLDRSMVRRHYSRLIERKDQDLIRLKSIGSRMALVEARSAWIEREEIHQRLQVVSPYREAPISLSEIEKAIDKLPESYVYLRWIGDADSQLQGMIQSQLSLMRHKMVEEQDRSSSTQTVEVEYLVNELDFNVSGFQKYVFVLNLSSTTGARISFSTEETGRHMSQARAKAIQKMENFLAQNIHQLNLN